MALALLTSTSMPPNAPSVASMAARTCSSCRMSATHAMARPPAASISRTASCTVPGSFGWGASVLPTTAMFAPSLAARSAIALPMPRVAPVMKRVLPARLMAREDSSGFCMPDQTNPTQPSSGGQSRGSLPPGAEFAGRFVLRRVVGRGSMGKVYEAERLADGAVVALKLTTLRTGDARARRRFEREAEAASKIESAHIARSLASGEDAATGTAWIAFELVRGPTLDTYVRAHPDLP